MTKKLNNISKTCRSSRCWRNIEFLYSICLGFDYIILYLIWNAKILIVIAGIWSPCSKIKWNMFCWRKKDLILRVQHIESIILLRLAWKIRKGLADFWCWCFGVEKIKKKFQDLSGDSHHPHKTYRFIMLDKNIQFLNQTYFTWLLARSRFFTASNTACFELGLKIEHF